MLGDLNGKVGNQNVELEEAFGREGKEMKNDNGRRIT